MFKIADFIIDYRPIYIVHDSLFEGYIVPDESSDLMLVCTEAHIDSEEQPGIFFSKADLQFTAMHRQISEILPLHNAFVLHSATFDVDGVGVAFAAHSGTGKTTHMNLWQQLLGDKMTIVNGDKPIVRFFDEEPETPYAYGTPWNGKERLGCNMRTPLRHICFIERSKTNYVEKVQKQNVINNIFNQVYMPKDPMAVMNTMKLIDRLLSCTNLWIIHCNMEPEAAEVAYNTIINGTSSI